jgi:hypothetical protein
MRRIDLHQRTGNREMLDPPFVLTPIPLVVTIATLPNSREWRLVVTRATLQHAARAAADRRRRIARPKKRTVSQCDRSEFAYMDEVVRSSDNNAGPPPDHATFFAPPKGLTWINV